MNAATTRIVSWADRIPTLQKATGELHSLASTTESQIRTVARVFEAVAGDTNSLMSLAAAIVDCVEKENISSVRPRTPFRLSLMFEELSADSTSSDQLEIIKNICWIKIASTKKG